MKDFDNFVINVAYDFHAKMSLENLLNIFIFCNRLSWISKLSEVSQIGRVSIKRAELNGSPFQWLSIEMKKHCIEFRSFGRNSPSLASINILAAGSENLR